MPNCGVNLPQNIVTMFVQKEARELGLLLLGVVFGAVLGMVGNLWASFLVEFLRGLIPQSLWNVSLLLGLIVTTIVSAYIIVRMLRYAVKFTIGEARLEEALRRTREQT